MKKAHDGNRGPELSLGSLERHFQSELHLPRSCKRVHARSHSGAQRTRCVDVRTRRADELSRLVSTSARAEPKPVPVGDEVLNGCVSGAKRQWRAMYAQENYGPLPPTSACSQDSSMGFGNKGENWFPNFVGTKEGQKCPASGGHDMHVKDRGLCERRLLALQRRFRRERLRQCMHDCGDAYGRHDLFFLKALFAQHLLM